MGKKFEVVVEKGVDEKKSNSGEKVKNIMKTHSPQVMRE